MYHWAETAAEVGRKLIENELLHLIWRKYPRSCNSPEGMKTKNSSSTQTEESSSVGLLKFVTAGNSLAPDIDSNSTTDNIRERFYPDDSATTLDSGSSGRSTNESRAPENTSLMSPSKRQPSKPLIHEKKFQTELSNRFDCLEEVNSPEDSYVNAGLSDRESRTGS